MTAPLPTDPVALARIAYLGLDPERVPRSRAASPAYQGDERRCHATYLTGGCARSAVWVQVQRRYPDDWGGRPCHRHRTLCADHAATAKATPGGRESYWQEVGT